MKNKSYIIYNAALPFHPKTVFTPTYFQHDVTYFIISLLLLLQFTILFKFKIF